MESPAPARLPHAHPLLPYIIGGLCVVVLMSAYLAFANQSGWWPFQTAPSDNIPAPVYRNEAFGFSIALPESWRGFTVNHIKEDIYDVTGATTTNNGVVDSFQLIELHHPLSTATNPREKMPIMVFTLTQWAHIQDQEWSVGAAPFPPSELGRNSVYVLALPARYNYDFKEGWEEVDVLVHTLQAFEPESEGVFCTQDAKLCPDGSYVGRVAPNCEFAPCP